MPSVNLLFTMQCTTEQSNSKIAWLILFTMFDFIGVLFRKSKKQLSKKNLKSTYKTFITWKTSDFVVVWPKNNNISATIHFSPC